MSVIALPEIPRDVLAHLLDLCGTPAAASPRHLMGVSTTLTPLQIAELYGAEYLTCPEVSIDVLSPFFLRVAKVILNPVTSLTFRIWGAEDLCAETSVLFPSDVVAGGGVVLQQVERHYHVAAFVEPKDILSDLAPVLPYADANPPKPFDFETHLDAPVAAVLFGLADLERGCGIGGENSDFSEVDVSGYLAGQWGMTGFDQLVSYVTAVGMRARPPSLTEVEYALGVLVQAGAVVVAKTTPDRYALSPDLRPFVALTKDMTSGLQWQRATLLESGDTLVVNRIYVYGDNGLTLCIAPTVKGRILMKSVSRNEVVQLVVDELSGVAGTLSWEAEGGGVPDEESTDVVSERCCSKCGNTIDAEFSFCTQCGTPIEL